MSQLARVSQSTTPGDLVTLFRLDATILGGGVYFFAQSALEDEPIIFGGVTYTPVDVEFSDFEMNGNGSLPMPKMRIANSNAVIQGMVNAWGDMLGCEIRRVRTFRQFLDGQPEADPTVFYGPDVFLIERKVSETALQIEWELSANIDQEGKLLPGRQIIRDTCMWRYRRWDPVTGQFDYSKATCPYDGSAMFDALDQPTSDPSKDRCARRLGSCNLRYGVHNPKPFGGFPGAARVRR